MTKKKLPVRFTGQHFTIDKVLIKDAIRQANISNQDTVLDIGAGKGFLTVHLLKIANNVVAIENDTALVEHLRKLFSDARNVQVVGCDFRNFAVPKFPFKVVSNIPYGITSDIFKILMFESLGNFLGGSIVLQLEPTQKLFSRKLYNPYTVFYHTFFDLKLVYEVGPESFFPPPTVKSALLNIKRKQLFFDFKFKAKYLAFISCLLEKPDLSVKTALKSIFRKSQVRSISEKFIKIKNLKTIYQGKEINVDEVVANDIAIIEDIEELRIGDYLGVKPCLIQGLSHQHPALKSSVRPDKPEERSKLISALNVLFIEDPSLSFSINSYSDELEISLYGLTQKEIIQTLLEERFSVKTHFDEIKTIYKERPKKKVNKIIHIEVPPNPYWASIGLTLEPLPIGSGLQIESEISFGYLNHSFQNAVFEGIRMSCQSGLHGWEVTDLKVTFTYALYYSPISTPADFRQLSPYVFRLALQQSGVDILEPMLYFELQIPQVASSKAITDLQKMMSEIKGISCNNEWCLIEGKVPLNTSKDYASEVSSYTKGLGTFMVKPCGYQITKGGYSDNTRMEEKDKLLFMFEKSVSSK